MGNWIEDYPGQYIHAYHIHAYISYTFMHIVHTQSRHTHSCLQMGNWIEDYPGQLEQIRKGEPTRLVLPPPEHTYLSDRCVCVCMHVSMCVKSSYGICAYVLTNRYILHANAKYTPARASQHA